MSIPVIHITGLAGSGKSTLRKKLHKELQKRALVVETDDVSDQSVMAEVKKRDGKPVNFLEPLASEILAEASLVDMKSRSELVQKATQLGVPLIVCGFTLPMDDIATNRFLIAVEPKEVWKRFNLREYKNLAKQPSAVQNLVKNSTNEDLLFLTLSAELKNRGSIIAPFSGIADHWKHFRRLILNQGYELLSADEIYQTCLDLVRQWETSRAVSEPSRKRRRRLVEASDLEREAKEDVVAGMGVSMSIPALDSIQELISEEFSDFGHQGWSVTYLSSSHVVFPLERAHGGGERVAMFKLWRTNPYHLQNGPSDLLDVAAFCDFMKSTGVPVQRFHKRNNGLPIGTAKFPEGDRYYALLEYIPEQDWDEQLEYGNWGSALARFHLASEKYVSKFKRSTNLTSKFLLDRPRAKLIEYSGQQHRETIDKLVHLIDDVSTPLKKFEAQVANSKAYGYIHGDHHRGNVLKTSSGEIAFIDLEYAMPGYYIQDLAEVMSQLIINTNVPRDKVDMLFHSFLLGYLMYRELSAVELAALPLFCIAGWMWEYNFDIENGTKELVGKWERGQKIIEWFPKDLKFADCCDECRVSRVSCCSGNPSIKIQSLP